MHEEDEDDDEDQTKTKTKRKVIKTNNLTPRRLHPVLYHRYNIAAVSSPPLTAECCVRCRCPGWRWRVTGSILRGTSEEFHSLGEEWKFGQFTMAGEKRWNVTPFRAHYSNQCPITIWTEQTKESSSYAKEPPKGTSSFFTS